MHLTWLSCLLSPLLENTSQPLCAFHEFTFLSTGKLFVECPAVVFLALFSQVTFQGFPGHCLMCDLEPILLVLLSSRLTSLPFTRLPLLFLHVRRRPGCLLLRPPLRSSQTSENTCQRPRASHSKPWAVPLHLSWHI